SRSGLTACQMSTYGWPATSTYGEVTAATIRLSLLPGTKWSTSTPSRRPGPGANAATAAGRSSMPPSGSTTTPSTRRSSPQIRSTSSASCIPSTQIRLALATRAGASATAIEPEAVRVGWVGAAGRAGRRSVTGCPSSRNAAGSSGNGRRLPKRSSNTTAPASNPTTAPHQPDSASSTTSPSSASTSGTCLRGCGRQSTANPSDPYTPGTLAQPGDGGRRWARVCRSSGGTEPPGDLGQGRVHDRADGQRVQQRAHPDRAAEQPT